MIKIDFEFDSSIGVFRDALHLPDDHTFTDTDINAMKQQRFDNWWAAANPPPSETVETPPPPQTIININGDTYNLLEGTPPSGAKLIEVNSSWYVKV